MVKVITYITYFLNHLNSEEHYQNLPQVRSVQHVLCCFVPLSFLYLIHCSTKLHCKAIILKGTYQNPTHRRIQECKEDLWL